MNIDSAELRTPKIIKIGKDNFDIDLFQSQHLPEQLQAFSALLVEARRQLRIAEAIARALKSKAYLEMLDAKKDLPEWKIRCLFESSAEFARSQDDLITASYAVEVLEAAIACFSAKISTS